METKENNNEAINKLKFICDLRAIFCIIYLRIIGFIVGDAGIADSIIFNIAFIVYS